jgi:hypothetical protein
VSERTVEQRLADLDAQIESLLVNVQQHAVRVRVLEDRFDTRDTPLWKRIVFRLDGWPAWHVVAEKPRWRPWRRWWTS